MLYEEFRDFKVSCPVRISAPSLFNTTPRLRPPSSVGTPRDGVVQVQTFGADASEDQYEHEAGRNEKASLARAHRTVYALLILLAIATAWNIMLFIQMRNTRALLDAQSYGTSQLTMPTLLAE